MSNLRLFNTLGREMQDFLPQKPPQVSFYHCGPTVYWVQHIGNMRAMLMADLIHRSLLHLGYDVKFVRNYTDVGHLTGDNAGNADSGEDRMAKGARREGKSPEEIAQKYIDIFERDTAELNMLSPEVKPRATAYIQPMIDLVQKLIDRGFAYTTEKAVYFDISKKQDYTKLSGQKLEENKQGAGTGDVSDEHKRHPHDFALWFFKTGAHEDALQVWESPFQSPAVENGLGFPGWHIECSAMAIAELGETIDIHMGGIEHIPVHHTNEIAQSESATGQQFAKYWLHNEWLVLDGEKIAKSSGHMLTLQDILDRGYDALDLRYLFLGAHYRSKQNFTWDALDAARSARQNLTAKLQELKQMAASKADGEEIPEGRLLEIQHAEFSGKIADDFNVPQALAVAWETLKMDAEPEDIVATLLDFDLVLGLQLDNAAIGISKEERDAIELLIVERQQAREAGDYEKADQIRDQLKQTHNVELKDQGDKTVWFKI